MNDLIVELKAVAELLPIHEAQLLTYLKLDGKPLGLLINFNVPILKRGIKRIVCGNLFRSEDLVSFDAEPARIISVVVPAPPYSFLFSAR